MSTRFHLWWVTRASFLIADLALAAAFSPWGPSPWRNTPSLRWLHHLLPWTAISIGFLIAAVLIAIGRVGTLAAGDCVGALLWGLELIACLVTLHPHRVTNPFLAIGAFLVLVFHLAAARLAIYQAAQGDG